jgi:hypothetical protein
VAQNVLVPEKASERVEDTVSVTEADEDKSERAQVRTVTNFFQTDLKETGSAEPIRTEPGETTHRKDTAETQPLRSVDASGVTAPQPRREMAELIVSEHAKSGRHVDASFKEAVPAMTDARGSGVAELRAASPQVQSFAPPAFAAAPAAGPIKVGVELSDVGSNLHDKADQLSDGVSIEFEETVKTPPSDRMRAEPAAARSIINQVIQSVTRSTAEGVVEIRLQPEELGRIRLTMVAGEAGMTVQVTAERPETLDLVRRNIDMLENELLDRGFEGLNFSFAGEDRGTESHPEDDADASLRAINKSVPNGLSVALADKMQPNANGKLDIRV